MVWQKEWFFIVSLIAIVGGVTTLVPFSRRMFKKEGAEREVFTLTSTAFEHNEEMPSFYTCDGSDFSPPLAWKNPPPGTQSFVLIFHDPDALGGNWIHWVVYDLPVTVLKLEEHAVVSSLGGKSGYNSWDNQTYGGPCPPLKRHKYIFTLYAVDIPQLDVKHPVNESVVQKAMDGHIIDKALLMCTYQRLRNI